MPTDAQWEKNVRSDLDRGLLLDAVDELTRRLAVLSNRLDRHTNVLSELRGARKDHKVRIAKLEVENRTLIREGVALSKTLRMMAELDSHRAYETRDLDQRLQQIERRFDGIPA